MKVVIRISEADDARAWALLQRHSAGVALPNRTFVVSAEAANEIDDLSQRAVEEIALVKKFPC